MTTDDRLTADDAALVARVRAGDASAFAAIHARYRRPLLAFAARQLGARREEAEDVVQDAFIRAYRAISPTHGRSTCARGSTRSSAIASSTSSAGRRG